MRSIFIDADSCKRSVRAYLLRFILRETNENLRLVIVADRVISAIPQSKRIDFEQVARAENAADNHIAALSQKGDLVITRDIELSERLLDKGVCVITDAGEEYTAENIGAAKQRAQRNAALRTYMRSDTLPSRNRRLSDDAKLLATFAQQVNAWKQSL